MAAEAAVRAQWAQAETAYQRRADLIPDLVETVKGASDLEQQTLDRVGEARNRIGQLSVEGSEILQDPVSFRRFQQAQDALSAALQRLLVVVERYPELKSVGAFQDLVVQLESAENRIAAARKRFNNTARALNMRLKRIPTRWFVSALGWHFAEASYFESQPGAETAPAVSF